MRQFAPAVIFYIVYELMAGGLSLADTRAHEAIVFFDMASIWMMNVGMFSLAAVCGAVGVTLPGMDRSRRILLSIAFLGAIAIAWFLVMNVARHAGFLVSFGPLVATLTGINLALGSAFLTMSALGQRGRRALMTAQS